VNALLRAGASLDEDTIKLILQFLPKLESVRCEDPHTVNDYVEVTESTCCYAVVRS